MKTKTRRSSGALLLLAAAAFSLPASAQTNYPYNLTPAVSGDEGVESFQISPEGSRVVYLSDQRTDGVFELYSVALAEGGAPVRLNDSLVSGGGVHEFQLSMETGRVVYRADQDTDDVLELYSVAIGGGSPVKLNDPLVAGGSVVDFRISPDGRWAVYRADQDAVGVYELYSVSSSGIGTRQKLNGTLVNGGDVIDFEISPDSSRVVYRADQGADGIFEVYSVPIGGGGAVRLNQVIPTNREITSFKISPDSNQVVYRGDQDADEKYELFSVPIDGGDFAKINGFLGSDRDVISYEISPDSRWVVYRADEKNTDNVWELYRVSITGGQQLKLNDTLASGEDVVDFGISPDGGWVVYVTQAAGVKTKLSAAGISGGTPVQLNEPVVGSGGVLNWQISPDSRRVVYGATQDAADVLNELYSAPITGGNWVKLNGPLAPGGFVGFFVMISPDSRRVVYVAQQDIDDVDEIYSVAIAGGNAVKLNGPLVNGGEVDRGLISPDSSLVVYRADQETDEVWALFVGKAQAIWESGGGNWFSAANWKAGVPPDPTLEAVITVPASVRVTSPNSPARAESLVLGGVRGSSVLELADGTTLTLPEGAEILPGGVLRGDGIFSVGDLPLHLPAGAEVRAAEGERFVLQSGQVTNGGTIEAFGTPFLPAEVEVVGELTNTLTTGAIVGHDCTFRFPQDLVNFGSLRFGSGLNDVQGEVTNESRASITVSGGASAIFYGDVSNGGSFNVSASGGLESTAVFFGTFSGNGISGSGHVFLEGGTRPGLSPGTMTFGGEVSFGPLARLEIEMRGTEAGRDYDQVTVAGHLELGGALSVSLLDHFVPVPGMAFDLWEAGSVAGSFGSVSLPVLPDGLFWHAGDLNTTGELRVGLTPESYAEFAAFYGLAKGPDGDEEGDGILNLFEYLGGRNPLALDAEGPLPEVVRSGGRDVISFVLATPGSRDATVEVETSTTLRDDGPGGWEVIASRSGTGPWSGSAPVVLDPAGDGLQRITVANDPAGDPERFYRIRATLLP